MADLRRDGSRALEAAVEAHLERRVRQVRGRAFKFPPAVKGAPDRIVVCPRRRIIFVELKRAGEAPKPAQTLWHDRLLQMGHVVHVLDSKELVDAFISWAMRSTPHDPRTDLVAVKNRYTQGES